MLFILLLNDPLEGGMEGGMEGWMDGGMGKKYERGRAKLQVETKFNQRFPSAVSMLFVTKRSHGGRDGGRDRGRKGGSKGGRDYKLKPMRGLVQSEVPRCGEQARCRY